MSDGQHDAGPHAAPAARRRDIVSVSSVLRWAVAGAAVSAAWMVAFFVPAAVAGGPHGGGTALGTLLFSLLVFVPPGAVAGLLVGIVDLVLRRWVARGELGSRRPVVAGLALLGALAAAIVGVLRPTWSRVEDVAYNLAVGAVVAAVPALIGSRAYRRIGRATVPAPGDVIDEAH